jgi:hypothetical protein
MENVSISGLYYRYGKTEDKKIRDLLKKVKIVKKAEIGNSNTFGYYPLTKEATKKIMVKPRNVSLTFDATETNTKSIKGLLSYMKVPFLVKSSSRFFLKPDIGEVIDQIPWEELMDAPTSFKAICVNLDDYQTLDETEGEHFLMTATLLKDVIAEKKELIKKLHEL